jgi:hypothetical protein
MVGNTTPRVFISYARSDGEAFATKLRRKLEAKNIPLWQDRTGMEGGRDWWLQIQEALDHVQFMVLVMTPAALLTACQPICQSIEEMKIRDVVNRLLSFGTTL